jgi:TolB-like protein
MNNNHILKLLSPILIAFLSLLLNPQLLLAYEKEIETLSITLAEDIAKSGKKRIAVVDFTDLQGNVTEFGRFIAEEFSVALAGAGKGFEVVDRIHLKSILTEHKLSISGLIDPQTAKKLGQIAGIEVLVTGTITPFSDSIRLSVKTIDTATAKVIGASSVDIAKTKAIEELLGKGIDTEKVVETSTTTPSKSWLGISIYPGS